MTNSVATIENMRDLSKVFCGKPKRSVINRAKGRATIL